MEKIYVNQDWRLELETGQDLSGILKVYIKWVKPNGSARSIEARVLDPTEGIIYYDFKGVDLDIPGVWKFWAYVVFTDGKQMPGTPVSIRIYREGY